MTKWEFKISREVKQAVRNIGRMDCPYQAYIDIRVGTDRDTDIVRGGSIIRRVSAGVSRTKSNGVGRMPVSCPSRSRV